MLFLACDTVRKEARNLRKKKKTLKQPRKRKGKTNPPTEVEISELIYFNFQLTLRFSNLLTLKSTLSLGGSTSSKTLIIFFKQNLYPQLHGRQIKEQADEACPIQGGEFASTVINFRGELFSLSFSHIVVLKTFKANFLVVRTVREERGIAGLFTSLLPFPSLCFRCLESFLMTSSLSNCDIKVFCQSITSHQIGLPGERRTTDLLSKVCSSLCCVLNLLFLHLRTTSATCHASNSAEPQQHSRNQTLGKPN